MASIQSKKRKHGIKYYIVQRVPDDNGVLKPYWIPCNSKKEANYLLDEVQAAEKEGIKYARPPNEPYAAQPGQDITVKEMMEKYIEVNRSNWEPKSMQIADTITKNYIYPIIGDVKLATLKPMEIQRYYDSLLDFPQAPGNRTGKVGNVSPRGVREVHKLLRPMLDMAVLWDYIPNNPALVVKLPKQREFIRNQWAPDEVACALDECDDELLHLAIGTQFAETTRSGELAALTWDCVHASEAEIAAGTAHIELNKSLARVRRADLAATGTEVIFMFPSPKSTKTVLVFKRPKTEKSRRVVYLPPTLAREYNRHREAQAKIKAELGEDYHDYGLVFARENGNPFEVKYLATRFKDFCAEKGLRPVDFYSLRHSGATAKLRLTHDLKSVQGDMGHSTPQMLTKVYTAILDEDRRNSAALLEKSFYGNKEDSQH